ncbi:camp-regulated phosphoprotein family protein Igo1 [Fusarium flagelliforme]|uniref:camp-regulated phosphoprotein family protein Igo1 n=1 Tax=Fusarium flagelliforme TaxID=2675880 RepID=UPI001E8ED495|nr:camp-regulated phosphoprotein family protein Igo1 [Fusarium flagelliforme]KAH7175174.1 camp-regulated phosphoprotein family protein Igo1 [Fusarium flagelliforme]
MDQPKTSEPNTEKNKHLLNRYGIVPNKGDLLHHQLEGRKYFDSGDFALMQAHKSSDIGTVATGSKHPIRRDISIPTCSAPGSSNLDESADRRFTSEKKTGELKLIAPSHLQQETDAQREHEGRETKEEHNV